MLKHLLIKNYALIEKLEMEPAADLNIITGETGAGKSIMLGAIGLLLGNRADTKVLFNENEKCIIEATFDLSSYHLKLFFDEEEIEFDNICFLRREISASGKSRAFINDTPVNLEQLKKLGNQLMDVHSQHETLLLGNSNFQTNIVDVYAANGNLLAEYKICFKSYHQKLKDFQEIQKFASDSGKEFEFNTFLLNELIDADLQANEQEKLEEELKLLENSEEIKSKLHYILQALSNSENAVISSLQLSEKYLSQLLPYSKNFENLHSRLNSSLLEIKDVAEELEREESAVEFGAERMEEISTRLSKIYQLQKKHSVKSISDLLEIQADLQTKVDRVTNLDEEVSNKKLQVDAALKELMDKGNKLSASRSKAAPIIKTTLENLLREVGMPNATVEVGIKPTQPVGSGIDQISILFSANKGIAAQELKNAASGGEFSRLMLCIKYLLTSKTALPTIVFDEIDTGISGEIAIKVGKMMQQMAASHQVIAISHLPQIASRGNAHYFVYKDESGGRTISKVKKLTEIERIKEIAEMIGGKQPSDTAVKNAKELLSVD